MAPFKLPEYREPHFGEIPFKNAPNARTALAPSDGIAPSDFHVLSIFPEYFKVEADSGKNEWLLPAESRMDCVPVLRKSASGPWIDAMEFRNLKRGDMVVVGRTEDGSEGIYVDSSAFSGSEKTPKDAFAFRTGRSRETAYSRDYDELYELLSYEKEHGYIIWVLGPAVSFDYDSRHAMKSIIEKGYAHVIMAGNALATHDLEGALFKTALGQDIYTQESRANGHYNHLDLLNLVRGHGSIEKLIEMEKVDDGIVHAALKKGIPLVLTGSIRDDGPLPEVYGNVYEAQDAMRAHMRKATTVMALATQLHTIAVGNITPSYALRDGKVRPVYFYSIDISEFAVNKLRDRGTLSVVPIVTNVQDFLVLLKNNL